MTADPIDELRDPRTGALVSTAARYRPGSSAKMVDATDYDETAQLTCRSCNWTGTGAEADREIYGELFDISCPSCEQMLLIVSY